MGHLLWNSCHFTWLLGLDDPDTFAGHWCAKPGTGQQPWGMTWQAAPWRASLWAYSKTWDTEGILGNLPAIDTSLIGECSGYLLKSRSESATKAVIPFYNRVILMCVGHIWGFWSPIGKSLWTISYVCLTGAWPCSLPSFIYSYGSFTGKISLSGYKEVFMKLLYVLIFRPLWTKRWYRLLLHEPCAIRGIMNGCLTENRINHRKGRVGREKIFWALYSYGKLFIGFS